MSWNDKRPMSPHLQIYKLPLIAKLSILHRVTGAIIFIGLVFIVGALLAVANGAESWQSMHHFLSNGLVQLVLVAFTFSLYYHLSHGVRHLLWDIGKGFGTEGINKSLVVIAIAVLLTLLTWLVVFIR